VAEAQAATTDVQWRVFVRKFRAEMGHGDAEKVLDTLAALSASTHFAIGCYCEDEARCHRGVLRQLLAERGAVIRGEPG
jgi:uncharacterized protein YeaO (DUF488 family)